ncbi:pygopus homolog 1-like [Mytilus edulis]|uniref:pygopus homolog 1-like n=1 Tax=Mytilus edulis TaxID=6550 RepID=UPI0039EEEBCC
MSYPCVLCDQQVRPRQHALQCEDCDKWQHRLCNTGISITDYRLMVNEEVDIIFHCVECVHIPQDMEVEVGIGVSMARLPTTTSISTRLCQPFNRKPRPCPSHSSL